jgi:hypothetical protein
MEHYPEVADLVGKVLTAVRKTDDDRIEFDCEDGTRYALFHDQECCESVTISDINGDLGFLVGSPILLAEAATNREGSAPEYAESFTWTFYRFATVKGYVDIRWLGQSNGYYSEGVSFGRIV